MRTKLEILTAIVLILVSSYVAYGMGKEGRTLTYRSVGPIMDFEIRERKPKVIEKLVYLNKTDSDQLWTAYNTPISMKMKLTNTGILTYHMDVTATDSYKKTSEYYTIYTTPNWKIGVGIFAVGAMGGGYLAYKYIAKR